MRSTGYSARNAKPLKARRHEKQQAFAIIAGCYSDLLAISIYEM